MEQGYGRMGDAVEHSCLHCGVMKHVFEDDILSNLKVMIKGPRPHPVATQAAVGTEPIGVKPLSGTVFISQSGVTDGRMLGHLKTIGHVTTEAYVENGCMYAVIFYYIEHLSDKWSGLPSECAAWFQYHFQPWITLVEALKGADEAWNIIVFTRHKMSSTEVYPLQLTEPWAEFLLNMLQCALESITSVLAVTVNVEAINVIWQRSG